VEEDKAGRDECRMTKMKIEQKHGLSAQVQPRVCWRVQGLKGVEGNICFFFIGRVAIMDGWMDGQTDRRGGGGFLMPVTCRPSLVLFGSTRNTQQMQPSIT
jgi:hypothetical protein